MLTQSRFAPCALARPLASSVIALVVALLSTLVLATENSASSETRQSTALTTYSPPVRDASVPTKLLWGDTHLHTKLSGDAYMTGTTTFGPEEAYRFARGDSVISQTGVPAKLRAPLDFLVVSDHSEFLGLFAATEDRDAEFLKTDLGKRWRNFMDEDDIPSIFTDFQRMIFGDDPDRSTDATKLAMWQRVAKLADQYNDPGRFSALIGYEWSSTPNNSNLHRNVIFRDGADVADYETWDAGNFSVREGAEPKQDWMLQYEYARSALKLGLKLQESLGANPYQFGMIGSTDAHTGLSAVEENNFYGKFPESEPNPERSSSNMDWLGWSNSILTSSGLAAVWATENTREAIFDAMRRKEVYATTGPRIGLRLFAGWNFIAGDEQRSDFVQRGYDAGVPMGGTLEASGEVQSPTFLIVANKDPHGASLDRVQVVKGWVDSNGELQERVFDVAVSGGRKIDPDTHQAAAIASTVDLESARYSNKLGAAELRTFWRDPQFNPTERAFYYVRVLQIPTPRWPTYDKNIFGTEPAESAQLITQDRAYSSPVWIKPLRD